MWGNARTGGICLILGGGMGIILMVLHPLHFGAPLFGVFTLNGIVHGAAILSAPLMTFGFHVATQRLGADRPLMGLALCFYAFAAASIIGAATMSGLVAPALNDAYHAANAETAARLAPLGNLEHFLNQAFAHVYTSLASIAILLWSIAWPAQGVGGQVLRGWGVIVALGVLCWQMFAGLVLDLHGMLAVTVLHTSFAIAVGVVLLTRKS